MEGQLEIYLMNYFHLLEKRDYTLLNIALTRIMTELPFLNIKRYRNQSLQIQMKSNYLNEFLIHFQPRISGITWRDLEFFDVLPSQIRSCSEFFKGQSVQSVIVRKMIVENSDL